MPVAMVAGPPMNTLDENNRPVQTQDLFVAEADIIDGKKSILQVPVSLTETRQASFSEASGNRIRIVGQPYVEHEDFKFTGPSDMELGPDPFVVEPQLSENSAVLFSDEDSIFVFYKDLSGRKMIKRIIKISGRRFSGMAFDQGGKFYFADYSRGQIWMMTWDKLRALILGSSTLVSDQELSSKAYLIKD